MNENEKIMMKMSSDIATIMATLNGDFKTMKEDIKEIQSELRQQSEKTSEITALRDRLTKVESTHVWYNRTIIGFVLGGIISLVMSVK